MLQFFGGPRFGSVNVKTMICRRSNLFLRFVLVVAILLVSVSASAKKKGEKPPERAIMHNNRGVEALYTGDYDRALFEFKTATELAPKYVEAWANLGLAYKYKGRFSDAEAAIKTAIDLDPKYAGSYNHLGAVYYDMGRYDDALKLYQKSLHYNEKLSDAHYNASLVWIARYNQNKDKGNLDKAVDELQKATTTNAEHAYAHKELAKAYQDLGDYEKAIIRYKLALEIDPKMSDGWVSLANLYTLTGQTLKAQQALNKALELNPNSSPSHLNMGLNYLKDDNYRMALKEFDQAVREEPANELAYFNIGYTYYKMGVQAMDKGGDGRAELQQSNRAYESAFRLRSTYAEAAFNVGYNDLLLKDYSGAVSWFQKAVDSDADFSGAYFALGQAYQGMGNSSQAAASFCSFLKKRPSNMAEEVGIAENSVKALGGCK